MENYTITKKQIAILSNTSHEAFTYLNEEFPEAFKTELTIGKWYKYKLALFYVTNKRSNNANYYNVFGFDVDGNWMTDNATTYFDEKYIEATPEEVESALKSQAQKLGFKDGVKVFGLYSDGSPHQTTDFIINKDDLTYRTLYNDLGYYNLGFRIFANGKWAEILPQEKTVVPMEKALKIIAKKMKVSPEDIEIKN